MKATGSPFQPTDSRSSLDAASIQPPGKPPLLEDYSPLADSLEWQLGQRYWDERGVQSFLADAAPVPYLINNDGLLSRNAAAVFFAALAAAEDAAPLPSEFFALELGIGVGLFARYFLDAFQQLCNDRGKDYYDRLTYVCGDRSAAMLRDAFRRGVFGHHAGRVVLRVMDACQPEQLVHADRRFRGQERPFVGVFCNYILDCLPHAALEVDDAAVRQLCCRTSLARGVRLEEHTDLTLAQLRRCAASTDPDDQRSLLDLFPLFHAEYQYRSVDPSTLPYGPFAVDYARRFSRRVLLNYGAIQAIEPLLPLLAPGGFLLVNDYGTTVTELRPVVEHQRFSNATSIGLNFPLLKAYFEGGGRCQWVEPLGDDESIHARLLGHNLAYEMRVCFDECFGAPGRAVIRRPAEAARRWAQAGRLDSARASYEEALLTQPHNWSLLAEFAGFLTYSVRDLHVALDACRRALVLNPTAPELWDHLGDVLLEWGRHDEARTAYSRAVRLKPRDVRGHLGLAWVHYRCREYADALPEVAACLATDPGGQQRERVLGLQAEILAAQGRRFQEEMGRQANRIRS